MKEMDSTLFAHSSLTQTLPPLRHMRHIVRDRPPLFDCLRTPGHVSAYLSTLLQLHFGTDRFGAVSHSMERSQRV